MSFLFYLQVNVVKNVVMMFLATSFKAELLQFSVIIMVILHISDPENPGAFGTCNMRKSE